VGKGYTPKFNRNGRPRIFERETCEIGVERYEKDILKNRRAHVGDIDLFNHLIVAKKEQLAEAGKPTEFKQPSTRTMYRTLSVMATSGPHQLIVPKKPQKTDQNKKSHKRILLRKQQVRQRSNNNQKMSRTNKMTETKKKSNV